ncbi:MAG TPA: fibronectin type III domain-containing protein [Candidatus Paceibacterota bacterium]|nr:fibronectin type III domain-containing protein [Candidatus Paceibacterota bacterium]
MKTKYLGAVLAVGFACLVAARQARAQTAAVLPAAPASISASALANGTVNVSWAQATDTALAGYYLYRNGAFIASIPGYTYYIDAPASGVYSYTVSSYDIYGNISPQTTPTAALSVVGDTIPPTAPTDLVATPSSSSIQLSWGASTDNVGVVGYYISRNGIRIQTTNPISGTTYTDTGLATGVAYTYSVIAYDAARNTSAPVNISATTLLDTQPPSVPAGVMAAAASPTQINLTWQPSYDNVQVSGYAIYRNSTLVTDTNTTSTSYSDTGLTPQTTYSYRVAAYDEVGNASAQSLPPVSATTMPQDFTPPSTPPGVTVTATSPTAVTIAWQPSTDNVAVAGYYVYRDSSEIATLPSSTLNYQDSGLATGTAYLYTVAAYDTSNNISPIAGHWVTTPANAAAIPAAPAAPAAPTTAPTTTPAPATPSGAPAPAPVSTPPYTFTATLSIGSTGTAVQALQTFLIAQGDLGPAYATGYFGSLTQAAVQKFQCAEDIVCSGSPAATGWGTLGPKTRKSVNALE